MLEADSKRQRLAGWVLGLGLLGVGQLSGEPADSVNRPLNDSITIVLQGQLLRLLDIEGHLRPPESLQVAEGRECCQIILWYG